MTERKLFLSPQVYQTLHAAQLDAIELAALDCSYTTYGVDWGTDSAEALLAEINENPAHVSICTSQECTELMSLQRNKPSRGLALLPKGVVLLHSGEGRFDPLRSQVSSPHLRYMIGATSPVLLRGLLGSVLEYQIGIGHRGVLPRIATAQCIEVEQRILKSSSERGSAHHFVSEYSKNIVKKFKSNLNQNAQTYSKSLTDILDELLMNAIWDANPEHYRKGRTEICNLEIGKEVIIECSCDGVNLALTVEDKQGTFPWTALFGPQSFALGTKPELKINEGPGGAGLGLYMVLQRTSILSFEVKKDQYTRVTAVLRLDESARDMQARPKTILVFEDDMYAAPVLDSGKHQVHSVS